MSETKLTIAVSDYLKGEIHKGKQVIKLGVPFPDLLWAFIANEGRSEADGTKFKRMGVRRGMPDLMFWWAVEDSLWNEIMAFLKLKWFFILRSAAIELKFEGGKQSPYQKDFQYRFEKIRGRYAICRSVQEVRDTLVGWGLKCHYTACIEPIAPLQVRFKAAYDWQAPPMKG